YLEGTYQRPTAARGITCVDHESRRTEPPARPRPVLRRTGGPDRGRSGHKKGAAPRGRRPAVLGGSVRRGAGPLPGGGPGRGGRGGCPRLVPTGPLAHASVTRHW